MDAASRKSRLRNAPKQNDLKKREGNKEAVTDCDNAVKTEKKEKDGKESESSPKITNFFPVLKTEGRAKMCSSSVGDAKQKEILQKLVMAKDSGGASSKTASVGMNAANSEANASSEIVKGMPKKVNVNVLNSALKTSLSKVIRKNIEAADIKKEIPDSSKSQVIRDKSLPASSNSRNDNFDFVKGVIKKEDNATETTKVEEIVNSTLNNEDTPGSPSIPRTRRLAAAHSAKSFTSTMAQNSKHSHQGFSSSVSASPKLPETTSLSETSNKVNAESNGLDIVSQASPLASTSSSSLINESSLSVGDAKSTSEFILSTTNVASSVSSSENSSSAFIAKQSTVNTDIKTVSVQNQTLKTLSKVKKGKKRHFRGGTYGLYLTKAKKRKKMAKMKTEPGAKDDEISLTGTENGSYIDSEDGYSLISEDFNTPSEKSLADDESSRCSPILLPADTHENKELIESSQNNGQNFGQQSFSSSPVADSANTNAETSFKQDLSPIAESKLDENGTEPLTSDNNATKVDTIADKTENECFISCDSKSNTLNESITGSNENTCVSPDHISVELFSDTKDVMDASGEEANFLSLSQEMNNCEEEEESIHSNRNEHNDVDMTVLSSESGKVDNGGKGVEENGASVNLSLNVSGNSSVSDSTHQVNEEELPQEDAESAMSTIATCVKSRQRIKRRFTDDIVDTDVGLLSLNPMSNSRKCKAEAPKGDVSLKDIVDSFLYTGNVEAKAGPITKIECVYNPKQPPISNCSCEIQEFEANQRKDDTAYCQAVDSIDDKLVGCCNPVVSYHLVRSSVKIPFTVMCEMHLWRLKHHHCCPNCGLFCTQGPFMQCTVTKNDRKEVHLFHEKCQVNFDDGQPSFCLHCGGMFSLKVVQLELHMSTPPTFFLSQRPVLPTPKARISFPKPGVVVEDESEKVPSDKTYTITDSLKVLSSAGLPLDTDRTEVDAMLYALNSEAFIIPDYIDEEIYIAASEGDTQRVLHILAQGFNPNQKFPEHDDDIILHIAAASGKLIMVHLLVQAGSMVDTLNEKLCTPLMLATENSHADVVQYLLKKGATADIKGEGGMTCLHLAARNGSIDICKIIVNSGKILVNSQDDGGWTAIVWASEHDHYDVVKYLLEKGGDPNIRDNEGNTGLHWAAFSGSVDICYLYLDHGCDVDERNEHGDTPLHIAARQDSMQCITLLLSRGASVHITNKQNQLPMECCLDPNSKAYLALSLNMLLKKITVKYKHKTERILHRDITRGKEQNAIQCVNSVDDDPPPFEFLYVTENCETGPVNIDRSITSLQSCHCEDDCTSMNCTCASISFKCWYDKEGCLLPDFNMLDPPMLFECNRACCCWTNCNNRVLQNGITARLQLIRTKGKGWGVRTLKDIPKGAFICEYVGELISDSEADQREDDSYLFDLDNRDGETYCLDARYYGNISRFINHLCEPNLVPVKVFVDHQDLSFPRIAFFSSREIKQYEELGFDYGEKFWAIKYKWFTCDCGSPNCKYSMDTIDETLANYYRRLQEEQNEEAGISQTD